LGTNGCVRSFYEKEVKLSMYKIQGLHGLERHFWNTNIYVLQCCIGDDANVILHLVSNYVINIDYLMDINCMPFKVWKNGFVSKWCNAKFMHVHKKNFQHSIGFVMYWKFCFTSYLRFCQSLMRLFIIRKHEVITRVESIMTSKNARHFHKATCLGIIPTCTKVCPTTQSVQTCTTKRYSIHHTKRLETWKGSWTEIMLQGFAACLNQCWK